jgi:outer membrane protein assembly factor BamD
VGQFAIHRLWIDPGSPLRMLWRSLSSDCLGTPPRSSRIARLLALVLLALPLGACSSFSNFNIPFFATSDIQAPDEPAEKLYNEGVYLMNQKSEYKDAAKKFEEVERQHPYSEWARKSLIMVAYARYEGREYDEAVTAARRYVALHPSSPDAAYAQFLIGSAYYDQIPDVTRDQARAERAIAALEEVVRKFPTTEYAVAAKQKIAMARDQLAGKEMTIGRYYQNRKDFTGAINRFKIVVTQYQTTRHVEEALMRLTEAYMALGIVNEAQTAAAVLGHNFPDSRWYADAYKLVKTGGVEPVENKASWISQAFKKMGVGMLGGRQPG